MAQEASEVWVHNDDRTQQGWYNWSYESGAVHLSWANEKGF